MFDQPSRLRLFLLFVLLAIHMGITTVALLEHGPVGFLQEVVRSWAAGQVFFDLVIALLLVGAWILRDARARGGTGWPWVVASLVVGSFSPLVYLLNRERALLAAARSAR